MDNAHAALRRIFEDLDWPDEVSGDLARRAHVVVYEKGATVFHAGEPADLLYIVLSGEVKLYYGDAEGGRLLAAIAHSGEVLRCAEVLGAMGRDAEATAEGRGTQLFTAEALSRCKVAIITKARLVAAARRVPAPRLLKLLRRVNGDWARLCGRVLPFLLMDVRSRLDYAIAEVAQTFGIADERGKLIPLPLSHEDFSELVGASRPMVSKHLKELAQARIFYKQNGRYILAQEGAAPERSMRVGVPIVAVQRRKPVGSATDGGRSRLRPQRRAGRQLESAVAVEVV